MSTTAGTVRTSRLFTVVRRIVGVSALLLALAVAAVSLLPTAFGYQRYVIAGKSMTGALSLGDVAFEQLVPVEDLRVGDVITYVPPATSGIENLVTHRIASITADAEGTPVFQTRGDANDAVDPWTFQLDQPEQARLAFSVPKIGWLFMLLAERTFRMALIGGPAVAVALATILDLWRGREVLRPRTATA